MGSLSALAAGLLVLTQPEVPQFALVVASLKEAVPAAEVVDVGDAAALAAAIAKEPTVAVAIGTKALELARARLATTPLVAAAVLAPDAGKRRDLTAVPLEPSADGALAALSQLVPAARRIAVIYPPGSSAALADARRAFEKSKLEVHYRLLEEVSGFQELFRSVLAKSDAIWLFPDARLARPEIVRFMVATSLEQRVALIGFLEAMTRAGALAALSADYAAIGKEAAKLAEKMGVKNASAPPFAFAAGKVSVNARTRALLGLEGKLPDSYSVIH